MNHPKDEIDHRIETIITLLDDKKAEELEVFNLEEVDYITDRVVIANALNSKHTLALLEHLKKELKPLGEEFIAIDISDEWIIADLGDILIHIMTSNYRQHYSIEAFLSELLASKKRGID
jgi:ribosome silencing factor RsfS/YbeB/iojap